MCDRFASIMVDDISNGDGIGAVLFTQGCTHKCEGCHNPHTWDFNGGYKFTDKYFNLLFQYYKENPIATRLTLSGGDPLDNLDLSLRVAKEFKRMYPEKSLWIYTGYLFDDLVTDEKYKDILSLCDVLVDGEFKLGLRDTTLYCKGSSNQRVIDVKASLNTGKTVIKDRYFG